MANTLIDAPLEGQNSASAANTAVTHTFAADTARRHRFKYACVDFTGATGTATLTVSDGATVLFQTDLSLTVGATPFQVTIPGGGLIGTVNTAMTVTVSAGGALAVAHLSTAKYTL